MVYIEYAQVNVIMTSCCCWPPRWNHCVLSLLISGKRIPLLYKNGFILFYLFSFHIFHMLIIRVKHKKKRKVCIFIILADCVGFIYYLQTECYFLGKIACSYTILNDRCFPLSSPHNNVTEEEEMRFLFLWKNDLPVLVDPN
jgi:hypothetical protein